MTITFLGTGAAELNPNPFCHCVHCEEARRLIAAGTYKPRKRTATMLGNQVMVDFGPDVMAASMDYSAPMTELEHIFITHTHEDHLSIPNIGVLTMTKEPLGRPVNIYLSPQGYKWIFDMINATSKLYSPVMALSNLQNDGLIKFHSFTPYENHKVGDMEVYAVQSNHMSYGAGEYALNYRFTLADGKKILYVTDSGLYSDYNLKMLGNSKCDMVIMEGTRGLRETHDESSHLNAELFCRNIKNFIEYGIVKEDAKVYATHIATSPEFFLHDDTYQKYLNENCGGVPILAVDGLKVEF